MPQQHAIERLISNTSFQIDVESFEAGTRKVRYFVDRVEIDEAGYRAALETVLVQAQVGAANAARDAAAAPIT